MCTVFEEVANRSFFVSVGFLKIRICTHTLRNGALKDVSKDTISDP